MNEPASKNPIEGVIPLHVVAGSVNLLCSLGLDPQALLQGTSVTVSQLSVDCSCTQIVPFSELIAVFDNSLKHSEHPDIGLRMGRANNLGVYGVLGYGMLCSATDIDAVNLALKYQKIILGSHVSISMTLEHDRGVVRVSDSLPQTRARTFYMEQLLSGFLGFNRSLLGREDLLHEIRFDYDDPGYRRAYEEAFRCSIRFNAPFNDIVFDKRVLGTQLPNADPETAAACEAICESRLAAFDTEKVLSSKVKQFMRGHWGQQPDMADVAAWMAVDVRTLRRHLQAEGTSFRDLKNSVRRDMAIEHLRGTDLSVQDIATLTGFADASSFRKAFYRWTGNHPGYYRG